MYGLDKAKDIVLYALKTTENISYIEDEVVLRVSRKKQKKMPLSQRIDSIDLQQASAEFSRMIGKGNNYEFIKKERDGELYVREMIIKGKVVSIGKGVNSKEAKKDAIKQYLIKKGK